MSVRTSILLVCHACKGLVTSLRSLWLGTKICPNEDLVGVTKRLLPLLAVAKIVAVAALSTAAADDDV